MQRICVFCGSSPGGNPTYTELATALGALLARERLALVYGGGKVGLMGVLADAALAHGGEVIGVIPQALFDLEVGHTGLPDLRIVASMHERKALMADLSDAFIALPGGLGTLEEFCEIVTWAQLGLHRKPCGLLNSECYFDPLIRFFDHMVEERFLRPEHRALMLVEHDPAALLDRLAGFKAPRVEKLIDRDAT